MSLEATGPGGPAQAPPPPPAAGDGPAPDTLGPTAGAGGAVGAGDAERAGGAAGAGDAEGAGAGAGAVAEAAVGPAPDLDATNFEKLNCLLDKTMAYAQFIKRHLPDQLGRPSPAKVGDKRKHAAEKEELVTPGMLEGGCALRHYQLVGVNWLISLFKNGINGILADEMGLGKTIITIGFLAHLWEHKICGPFLIVAPLSTLANWRNELAKWCPYIPVMLYHGPKDERAEMQRQFAERKKASKGGTKGAALTLITSYDVAMNDIKFLAGTRWRYMVVDEAHRLKNFECKLIRELKRLDTSNRLLVTGTPLQNNLSELWSLLNFIMPTIFDDLDSFKSWFDFDDVGVDANTEHIIHSEQQNQVISKLHEILRPFMLRRLKREVGLELPQKMEVVLYCNATPKQMERYEAIRTKSVEALLEAEGTKGVRNTRILNVVMQLRKVCNHPFLFEQFDPFVARTETQRVVTEVWDEVDLGDRVPYRQKRTVVETVTKQINSFDYNNPADRKKYHNALIAECGKFSLLHLMLPILRKAGHKVLLFSQMTSLLDLLEDYLEMEGFTWCRIDGSVSQKDRQARIDTFNSDPSLFLFLLSTRAGGLGINLCAADTVIIYDSDWNPQADLQAQDRCHRIGQTRPVCVYRLVTANTVESYLLKRATQKLKLEHLVIEQGKFASHEKRPRLQLSDLEEVLKMTSHDLAFGKDSAISPKQLKKVLDREHVLSLVEKVQKAAKPGEGSDGGGGGGGGPAAPCSPASPLPSSTAGGFEVIEEVPSVF